MNIEKNKVVELHYTLTLSNGEEIDNTFEEAPLPYLHGYSNIVPGLERALEGHTVGDRLQVTIEPRDGYGEYDEEAHERIGFDELPEELELIEGDEIFVEDDEGNEVVGYIEEINNEEGWVLVDYNHPLAGETISFDVQVVSVRDATEQEINQGFVVDPYGDEFDDEDEEWVDDEEA